MKIFDQIDQRSEEWFELRKGGLSGSRAHAFYSRRGSKLKDEFFEILAERVARPLTPNDYADLLDGRPFSEMVRGEILEPQALEKFREWYAENKSKKSAKNIIAGRFWVSNEDDKMMLSPDGEIVNPKDPAVVEEAIEIKCLKSSKVLRAYVEQAFPDDYREQCLMYFLVNPNLKTLYRVIYTDLMPKLEIQVFEVSRAEIEDELEKFREYVFGALTRLNELSLELSDF